jgi:hypothetical protein
VISTIVGVLGGAAVLVPAACNSSHETGEGCHGGHGGADDCGAAVDESACLTTIVDCDGPEGAFAVGPVDCPRYGMSCPGEGGHTCSAGLVPTLSSEIAQYPGCPVYCCVESDGGADGP